MKARLKSWSNSRRFKQILALAGGLLVAAPLFAQANGGGAAAAAGYNPGDWARPLAALIGLGIAAGLCGIGQGKAIAAAEEGAARNPGAWNSIRFALILGLAFIESLTLYVFVIVFIKT